MTHKSLLYTIADTFNTLDLEVFLGNLAFVILFFLMILYWVEAIFSIIPKFNFIIFLTTLFANLTLFSLLVVRWSTYNHFPLSNLYESLIFLSWSFTLIPLILIPSILNLTQIPLFGHEGSQKPRTCLARSVDPVLSPLQPALNKKNFTGQFDSHTKNPKKITNINTLIGTIISPIALFVNSFAAFSLPKTMQKAQALVPALQSNWLMMHVTVMMLSYTALLCGSLLAITFLLVTWYQSKKMLQNKIKVEPTLNKISDQTIWDSSNAATLSNTTLGAEEKIAYDFSVVRNESFLQSRKPQLVNSSNLSQEIPLTELTRTLDNLSYRILGIGFPLLTIGILSGAVWANEAWGSYWSWDPKETWAFITWLVFAIYLHMRITKGWEGRRPALLATFGFFVVWICYLGVNILGTGLHSYGWIT